MFIERDPDSLISVSRVPEHFNPLWQIRLGKDNLINLFMNKYDSNIKDFKTQRQILPISYYRNGAIYIIKKEVVKTQGIYGDYCIAFPMEKEDFINIDSMADFKRAEFLIKEKKFE